MEDAVELGRVDREAIGGGADREVGVAEALLGHAGREGAEELGQTKEKPT